MWYTLKVFHPVVVCVVYFFMCYLHCSSFTLVIHHQPLKFLMELDRLISKLAKWALILYEYDFDIVHKAGKVN